MPIATLTSSCGSRLSGRDSSSRNGTAKWKTTSSDADDAPAGAAAGAVYQVISSGRLPDQMIRYCENEKYAHSITNASIRFAEVVEVRGHDDRVERRRGG